MTEYTLTRGGIDFTVYTPKKPTPESDPVQRATVAEWKANIREGWARGKQNFIVLNTLAPVGATICVLRRIGGAALFARTRDTESPLWGWKECTRNNPVFMGEVALSEYATHWQPEGTRIWYPFSPGEPAVREEDMPGYDPDFDV